MKTKKFPLFLLVMVPLLVIPLLCIGLYFGTARLQITVPGMEPGLQVGDSILVNKLTFLTGGIQRGDLIAFAGPVQSENIYVKRVIGISGDAIAIEDGLVILNGIRQTEVYALEPIIQSMEEVTVPEGSVFVLGDNRNDSLDSRFLGPIGSETIIGEVIFQW